MAVLGSLFFNRTLKQFLSCDDLEGKQGQDLIAKIREQASSALEKILEVIPQASDDHAAVLKKICQEQISPQSEDEILDHLQSDTTSVRVATQSVLSDSQRINPVKLLQRLQKPDSPHQEILGILQLQQESIAPELLVKTALKLEKGLAEPLFKMATQQATRTDMQALAQNLETIDKADTKIALIRFLSAAEQPEAAQMLCQFAGDESKLIVTEALKNLQKIETRFNPSPLVHFIPEMEATLRESALSVLDEKMVAEALPSLTQLMTGKSEALREKSVELVIKNVDESSLEPMLKALSIHEAWGREQAVTLLANNGTDRLFSLAETLKGHSNEFINETAEKLAVNKSATTGSLENLNQALFNEDWQIREKAISALANSGNRSVISLLLKTVKKYPESAVSILKAVKLLGFSKGLEVTSLCLGMSEAAVQREALTTTAVVVTEKHAEDVRKGILGVVSRLQPTVRDTAKEVIDSITRRFNLPALKLDDENLFETRLIQIEKNREQTEQLTAEMLAKNTSTTQDAAPLMNIEDLKPGDLWMDRYEVIQEIGRGAMGRVLLMKDNTVDEKVILKFMHPELTADANAKERFLRELKYARKISHPNVIRIHDFLMSGNIAAISMEYFESHGLDTLIKGKKLGSIEQTLGILKQVSDGMWAAHQQKVIHRDLKPGNILVDDSGLTKVVDFGIASASSEAEATLTKTGMIIGTPAYISPERAKGLEADHRADIYALGVIAYAMLNGELPYKGEPMAILLQHIEGNAPLLHTLDKGVKLGVSMLVKKMMAVDVVNRYQTMQEVSKSIEELM